MKRRMVGTWQFTGLLAAVAAVGITVIATAPASNAVPVGPVTRATACVQLHVIRVVAREGGLTIGSTETWPLTSMIPPWWARQFKAAGLTVLARYAAAINDPATNRQYVQALTATAVALLPYCPS